MIHSHHGLIKYAVRLQKYNNSISSTEETNTALATYAKKDMTEEVASIASGTKKIRTCMLHKTIDKHLLDWQPFIIWHRDYGYIQTHTQSDTHMKHVDMS